MKLTPEEINLCRQIAERYKKESKVGDWIKDVIVAQIFLVIRMVQHGTYLECINEEYGVVTRNRNMVDFPLWTISDCLKFLRDRGYRVKLDEDVRMVEPFWVKCYGHKRKEAFREYADTILEACLKAVSAVLEEKKQ
jgi:hypothetical protein